MRKWRLEPVKSAGGTSYRLVAGRDQDRVRVNLGRIPLDVAERCLEGMQAEERATYGTPRYDRVLRLSAEKTEIRVPGDGGEEAPHMIVGGGTAAVVSYLSGTIPDDAFALTPEDYGSMTFAEYWKKVFWPARTGQKPDPACKISAKSTQQTEQYKYQSLNESDIGSTRLRDLDAWKFQAYLDSLNVAPRSLALHKAAYQALLNFAYRKGHIRSKHDFFTIFNISKRTKDQEDPLTLEEIHALLEAGTTTTIHHRGGKSKEVETPMIRAMYGICLGQGLRPSELLRCEWQDFNLEDGTMLVRGEKTEYAKDTVPLTPLAIREYKRYHEAVGCPTSGLMFVWVSGSHGESDPGNEKGKPMGHFRGLIKRDAKKAGIQKNVTPYLLRHSFATLAFLLGIPKEITKRIGRWSDYKMLENVYTRPRAKDLAKKLQSFDLPGFVQPTDEN